MCSQGKKWKQLSMLMANHSLPRIICAVYVVCRHKKKGSYSQSHKKHVPVWNAGGKLLSYGRT